MNVLLAGGAGYIGSHTCVELLEAGHSVVVADNYSNSCPEAIARVEEITGAKVKVYEADVCDPEAVEFISPVLRRLARAVRSRFCTTATTSIQPLHCSKR